MALFYSCSASFKTSFPTRRMRGDFWGPWILWLPPWLELQQAVGCHAPWNFTSIKRFIWIWWTLLHCEGHPPIMAERLIKDVLLCNLNLMLIGLWGENNISIININLSILINDLDRQLSLEDQARKDYSWMRLNTHHISWTCSLQCVKLWYDLGFGEGVKHGFDLQFNILIFWIHDKFYVSKIKCRIVREKWKE